MKTLRVVLENVQMRNLIYLFLGMLFIGFLVMTYKPNSEYTPNYEKINYDNILKKYSEMETYFYTLYYNDEVINGYVIAGEYSGSVFGLENTINPSNIYNLIKDKEYRKVDNEYYYDTEKIVISLNDSDVIKLIYDDIIVEYGG